MFTYWVNEMSKIALVNAEHIQTHLAADEFRHRVGSIANRISTFDEKEV